MRKDLFRELVESVAQVKEIAAGRQKPGRVISAEDVLGGENRDVAALRACSLQRSFPAKS